MDTTALREEINTHIALLEEAERKQQELWKEFSRHKNRKTEDQIQKLTEDFWNLCSDRVASSEAFLVSTNEAVRDEFEKLFGKELYGVVDFISSVSQSIGGCETLDISEDALARVTLELNLTLGWLDLIDLLSSRNNT